MNLIDMDRLRKELMEKGDIPIHEVFNTIWNQPIVNVSQPKVGHWITTRTFMHDGEFYCDKCKCDSPNNEKWDYCPNCGADMRGEEE